MSVAVDAVEHWPGARVVVRPGGGVSLWVALPPEVTEHAIVDEATRRGVALSPGARWFVSEPPGPHLRISVARLGGSDLRRALDLVGEAVTAARCEC